MVRAIDLLLGGAGAQRRADRRDGHGRRDGAGLDRGASADRPRTAPAATAAAPMSRRLTTPFTPVPRTHILSNTQYHVLLTNAGSGVSTCRGLDMTRWREDAAREGYGQFVYMRDVGKGLVWSAGFQPVCRTPESYEVIFAADKATFRRRDLGIETMLEVIVSPEHRAEIRRVTLVNHDTAPRELELTSYAEIVLAPRGADLGHPAFAKLFLETEWLPGPEAIVCRRRMRSASEQPLWAVHVSAVDRSTRGGAALGEVQYETDRARFLGRGRTVANPAAMDPGAVLSGTVGPVLDPVVSLRRRLRIEPGGSAVVAIVTAFAESRDEALAMADQFREVGAATRAFELAWAHIQVEHRHHDRSGEDAHLYQRLASHIIFAGSALRADPSVLAAQPPGPARALAVRHLGRPADRAGADRRRRRGAAGPAARGRARLPAAPRPGVRPGPARRGGGQLPRRDEPELLDAVRAAGSADRIDQPGGIFVRRASQMSEDERVLLQAAARVVLVGDRGSLASQLDRTERHTPPPARLAATRDPGGWADEPVAPPAGLLFANGLGGFTPDGREYCILVQGPPPPEVGRNGPPARITPPRRLTLRLPPAPWVNVVANPACGFVATEAGSGFTWAVNSQANRLTPWSNDPVSDPPGEVVYLRDEETGEVWSPTPLPVPSWQPTLVRHGQGYTVYERNTHGLAHELTVFVPPEDPVKLIRLKVRNAGDRPRRLSATFYAEWVLGLNRDTAAMHVVTEVDAETGALLARNAFRTDFSGRVAFADVDRRPRTLSADRLTFLGRHGSLAAPAAMGRQRAGRAHRRRDRPLRRHPGPLRAPAGRRDRGRLPDRRGRRRRGGPRSWSAATASRAAWRRRSRRSRPAGRTASAPCRCARPTRARPAGQPMAALPGARLPVLGAVGVLPVGRRLRVPRPAPGRHGAGPRRARDHPGAHPPRGVAPVPRGRRAALVAPADGPRHPHADLRRPGLAAVRRRLLHRGHRRRGDPRRAGRLPQGPAAEARARRTTTAWRPPPASPARSTSIACGAWIAWTPARRPRPAADGPRRLERRHEPRRRRRQGGERLAGLVRDRRVPPVRRAGRGARRRGEGGRPAPTGRRAGRRLRGERLGRRLVPPRLLRRRHAAGLGPERRLPDRLDAAVLGRALRRGRPRARPPGDGVRRIPGWSTARGG